MDRATFGTIVLPYLRLHAAEPMADIPRVCNSWVCFISSNDALTCVVE